MGIVENWLYYLNEQKKELEIELKSLGLEYEHLLKEEPQIFFPLNKTFLKDLKVACIMDEFSYDSYKEECILRQITPDNWENEINEFHPDLLFVESAWQGKDNLWYRKIANISKEYFAVTSFCQDKEIPVIFWNKEDPVYTDAFMPAAKCADVVFTTDVDCIKRYKECLNSSKVYLLHFAAQPKNHNPIEKYERKDKFCFAGAYYHRYPKRAEVFDRFAKIFISSKGFDIYDRNYQNSRPEHAFPKIYNRYILGRLEPQEIDIAYKGYYYGINMNSVEQSQSMFARRVFEMLASNTVTVGNYSRGVKNLFGDLTICTNDDKTLYQNLETFCMEEITFKKYRLLGLRKVLTEHLYEDRLNYIVEKVFGIGLKSRLPAVKLLLPRGEDIQKGIDTFQKLKYDSKTLFILGEEQENSLYSNIVYVKKSEAVKIKISDIIEDGRVGVLSTQNYYGRNYLSDLCLAVRYTAIDAVGKASYYRFEQNEYILQEKGNTYKKVNTLKPDRSLFSKYLGQIQSMTLDEFTRLDSIEDQNMLSIDEFNFCENYAGDLCEPVDDLQITDQGIPIQDIQKAAENIKIDSINECGKKLNYDEILSYTKALWKDGVFCEKVNMGLSVKSNLQSGEKKYIYINETYDIFDYIKSGKLSLFFGGMGDLGYLGVCIFLDQNGNKVEPVFPKPNVISSFNVPTGAKYFKLGMRISGSGTYVIQQIILGMDKNPNELNCFISRHHTLILTNNYPSEQQLYRNMFVHKRVKNYAEQGLLCDVMEWNSQMPDRYREFEGVNIIAGQEETLINILLKGKISTVCVHFISTEMWEVLKTFSSDIRIIIWVHGAEIQPWYRRKCNYNNKEEEEQAKVISAGREKLWNEIFAERRKHNLHFVFVSKQFADEICDDYSVKFEMDEYTIIHNCIDTNMFSYLPKNAEQRKCILSIRPYAANNYANDLTVKCILELSKRKIFDDLSFSLYGDGPLFEDTVKPLRKFKNVSLNRKFLRQDEIAELHKGYGVFLSPTRLDTQGVSRDEAMSSGMVVITNAVAAVPEFTDENCSILVPPEDFMAIADGVERLYKEPQYFMRLSRNARLRVESQTAKEHTIYKEVRLIKGGEK